MHFTSGSCALTFSGLQVELLHSAVFPETLLTGVAFQSDGTAVVAAYDCQILHCWDPTK